MRRGATSTTQGALCVQGHVSHFKEGKAVMTGSPAALTSGQWLVLQPGSGQWRLWVALDCMPSWSSHLESTILQLLPDSWALLSLCPGWTLSRDFKFSHRPSLPSQLPHQGRHFLADSNSFSQARLLPKQLQEAQLSEECLPSMCRALGSIPSTAKKNRIK
jgi:hypothetical protein